ncbi:Heme A synthase, cytochrome oxidase biogenesis protein Cox15-CtaA [hydrothermal vent metagenome]|uniref:Heme A synthase, cytochrome oxidase biogenesis protein Cox15-CtaA n=1 Tax=hydrothermal vent metagenome TaxID=652676 RepID=A0A3B0XN29_9ZZZZ
MNNRVFQRISLAACLLAFGVIVLGAYVRLSDAGLGCPDWPGCFGQLTAPEQAHELSRARLDFPGKEVHTAKAWKEMTHRYFASTLGLFILAMAVLAWLNRRDKSQQVVLPFILVGLVVFQGLLGMWTVTQLVRPTIVTLHLLTGLLTLGLLFWVFIKHSRHQIEKIRDIDVPPVALFLARLAVVVLFIQIFLGGWTSTNYVALYCPDFPTCQGVWFPETNFSEAFQFFKDPTVNYEGGTLSLEAGVTVHYLHRTGAIITALVLIALVLVVFLKIKSDVLRKQAILLLVLLITQVSLGIANVVLVLPIPIAVSHNAIAAALLLTLLLINYSLNPGILSSGTRSLSSESQTGGASVDADLKGLS